MLQVALEAFFEFGLFSKIDAFRSSLPVFLHMILGRKSFIDPSFAHVDAAPAVRHRIADERRFLAARPLHGPEDVPQRGE